MNLQGLFFNAWVDRIGMALVHFLWQGAAIAIVLAAALRILHKQSPQLRYLAASAALVAMVCCLPITACFLPWSSRGTAAASVLPSGGIVEPPPLDGPVKTARTELPDRGFGADDWETNDVRTAEHPVNAVVISPKDARDSAPITVRPESRAGAPRMVSSMAGMLQPALPWIVGAWLFGALLLAAWHLGGFRYLFRLKRRGIGPAPAEIEQIVFRLSRRLGIRRSVSVLVSQLARVPTVLGWLRPVILLPASILGEMRPEQLEMILAHELAHIRRLDYFWNLLQIAIETVLFYHPAVWWVSRRIREERENCCDRQAVAAIGNSLVYARALMRLAELCCPVHQAAAPAGSIAADGGSLELRIRRVLGLPIAPVCRSNSWLGGILAVLFLAAVSLVNITWAEADHPGVKNRASGEATARAEPLSMTAEAFARLSDADQRAILVESFKTHVEQGRNLFYETEQVYRAFESNNWEPGKPSRRGDSYHRQLCRCWWRGDSYKLEQYQYNDPASLDFQGCQAIAENAEERLGRNILVFKKNGEKDVGQGQVVFPNKPRSGGDRFHTFPSPDDLLGCNGSQQYFFQYLAGNRDKFEIKSPVSVDKVQLIVPWHGNKQVFVLDPQIGFLPIRFEAAWQIPATKDRKAFWYKVKYEVQEWRMEDKVWMPVKMVSKALTSENQLVIMETKILRFEAGRVKPADIVLPFTQGMRVADVVEGISYTADAQGNATSPVDDPNWKSEPPKGWQKGRVEEAYSMGSRLTATQRAALAAERESKSAPLDEGLKVLRAHPRAATADRIEAALKVLRAYDVGEREDDWATAIRELITIGKPAVPRLIEELDRTNRDRGLRAMGFVLRGIGDARAVPALIRAIPRLIQPPSSDFGLTIKEDPALLKFMWMNDCGHIGNSKGAMEMNGLVLFSYERPIREIMTGLEKTTHQSLGWRELNDSARKANGALALRRQRTLFLDHARKWADWWSHNWKDFVSDPSDAQLQQTEKYLDQFADTIARMPLPAPPSEIPCGPLVRIDGGVAWHTFEPYVILGAGRQPSHPGKLLENSPKDLPSQELLAWAEREGVDLLRIEIKRPGDSRTYFGFHPVHMKVWKIDNKRWKNLKEELKASTKLDLPPPWTGPISSVDRPAGDIDAEEPATFLFITRSGACGTLRIRSALRQEFVPGTASMGSSVLEYQDIFEREPASPTSKQDNPVSASSPTGSSSEKTDSTRQNADPVARSDAPPAKVATRQAEPLHGRVLYHDGTPAATAAVFLVDDRGTTIRDGKAWQGIRSDMTEDKAVTRTTADATGRFTLPARSDAKRIVVSAPRLDFWVAPTPTNAAKESDFTIKLPAPGRLVVKYDIPGGDDKAKLLLQVNTWDSPLSRGIQCTPAPLVANKGQVVLDNLPPGPCYLDREKNIAWGTYFCDRRLLTIESGKTVESNFIRDRGTSVVGQVVGLKKEMCASVSGAADSAGALVSVRSPDAREGILSDFELPLYGILKCGLDGRFRTEQLLPGKYAIVVEAWLPENPREMASTGIRRSQFIGRAVITVPEGGQPVQATVDLKPREKTAPRKTEQPK